MIKQFLVIAIAIILFAQSGLGQVSAGWQRFKSDPGKFEALFPGKPKIISDNQEIDGGNVTSHIYSVSTADSYFSIWHTDYTGDFADVNKTLMSIQGAQIAETNGAKLVSEALIRHAGYPGRTFTAAGTLSDGLKVVLVVRLLIVGRRLYQVIVVKEGSAASPDIEKFISSFRLIR